MGVRAPVVRVLAVRVRCEEGGRGASASVDATKLDPHLVLPPPPELHKLYELAVASYLKNSAS
jgi:hypothetical protein